MARGLESLVLAMAAASVIACHGPTRPTEKLPEAPPIVQPQPPEPPKEVPMPVYILAAGDICDPLNMEGARGTSRLLDRFAS